MRSTALFLVCTLGCSDPSGPGRLSGETGGEAGAVMSTGGTLSGGAGGMGGDPSAGGAPSTSGMANPGLALLMQSDAWLASSDLTTDNAELLNASLPDAWLPFGATTPTADTVEGVACFRVTADSSTSVHGIRDFHNAPLNGQQSVFKADFHSGTETHVLLALFDGTTENAFDLDLTDGSITVLGSGTLGDMLTYAEARNLGHGWWRLTAGIRLRATNSGQIRLYMRQLTSWTGTSAETIYVANPSLRQLTAAEAVAPNGDTWVQPTKANQPAVSPGVGGVVGVGGLFAQDDVYMEHSAALSSSTLSLAWLGHPSLYRNLLAHSADMVLWRAVASGTGDTLEILLRNDGTRDHWAVRTTISGAPTTLTLSNRGASWATAVVGVTISGGTLTWYVDGTEFVGGPITVPNGLDTVRAGQFGGETWNAVLTDAAAWNSALTQGEHASVARTLTVRGGLAWGDWELVAVAGQSNAGSAGDYIAALSHKTPLAAEWDPFTARAENYPGTAFAGLHWSARKKQTVDSTDDEIVAGQGLVNNGYSAAYAMMAESHRKLAVVQLAANGCPLAPGSYSWDPASDNVYTRMTDYLDQREAEMTGAVGARKLVWIHGEEDASAGNASEYQTRLEGLLSAWEAKSGAFDTIIVARLSNNQTALDPLYVPIVRAAQEAVGTTRGAWIDTDGFSVADTIHYDEVGKYRLGAAIAAEL